MFSAWLTIYLSVVQVAAPHGIIERLENQFHISDVESVVVQGITIYHGRRTDYSGGLVIFTRGGHILDTTEYCPSCDSSIFAADLDRDGHTEIVVTNYTYGAHCCTIYEFYRVKNGRLKYIGELYAGNGGITFKDYDRDGIIEMLLWNDDFAYFETSFAASPWYFNIIQLRGNRFVDVSKKFRALIEKDINRIKRDIVNRKATLPHHSLAVELYVRFKLIGERRKGLEAVRLYLPDSYRWLLKNIASIDSLVNSSLSERVSYEKKAGLF